MKRHLHGRDLSIVSSNCVGGRLSSLADLPYRSPTVGLWMEPADFVRFSSNLKDNLASSVAFDEEESRRAGHPIGYIGRIKIYFLHYKTIEDAREKWTKRAARVDFDRVILVMTDRDGATEDDLKAFDALPLNKIVLVSQPRPDIRSAVYVRDGNEANQVGDLYSHWHHLDQALSSDVLKELAR